MPAGLVRPLLPLMLIVAAALAGLWRIETTPKLWWDEGWTLTVARNWAVEGYYGRRFDAAPATPRMAAAFPVVAAVAGSFRLFGVGIWQGRLSGVVFLAGSLTLLYVLAGRLFGRRTAIVTLLLLVVAFPNPSLYPSVVARQVLGELPMILFVIAGALAFVAGARSPVWLIVAAVAWCLALTAKRQTLPFWLVSLGVPLALALAQRHWRMATQLALTTGATLAAWQALAVLLRRTLPGYQAASSDFSGLYDVTAFVFTSDARLIALRLTLLYGLPVACGLAHGAWTLLADRARLDDERVVVRGMLLTFTGSWYAWYLLASVGWERYLFPVLFIGSLFVAALLDELTGGFHWAPLKRALDTMWATSGLELRARLAIALIAVSVGLGARTLYRFAVAEGDASVVATAAYLNRVVPLDARIATYDVELLFLLNRRYVYPPDQTSVEIGRRTHVDPATTIRYDPLADDPDYLVVGPYSSASRIYEPSIAAGHFRPLHAEGYYSILQRVR